jgi:hypothetical protein
MKLRKTVRDHCACEEQREAGRLHFTARRPDQSLISFAAARRALRQHAHLSRHHSETASLFSGARSFDRCIERQNVDLKRDGIDNRDDVAETARALIDLFRCVTTSPTTELLSLAMSVAWPAKTNV